LLKAITTADGSCTLYSSEYGEHYHNIKDGALNESLSKHIVPAFSYFETFPDSINILDICFGLGYNTLATLYYVKQHAIDAKINIFSPELNRDLINNLATFEYPSEFTPFKPIIQELAKSYRYENSELTVEVCIGDAREYIRQFSDRFDIVYQDAFSAKKNRALWSLEYFKDIRRALKDNAIITTYSIASNVRYTMHLNGLYLYEHIASNTKRSTYATTIKRVGYSEIDMGKKLQNNPSLHPIIDS
jgi:tRNA U34 5-methylaminomethyl-2-thiouridine-forming methyltransferase MnmC